MREWVPERLESGLRGLGSDGLASDGHTSRKEVELGFRVSASTGPIDAQNVEGGLVLETLRSRPPTCRVMIGRSCLEKGGHVEPALSLARAKREQPLSEQTGRYGRRCGTFVGLTRRGRHPSRHGQLPGWTTCKATTEALAKDAVCRPFYMLQHRILRLS